MPLHILAVYPIAQANDATPSYVDSVNGRPLNKAMMGWFGKHVFAEEADRKDPRIALINRT